MTALERARAYRAQGRATSRSILVAPGRRGSTPTALDMLARSARVSHISDPHARAFAAQVYASGFSTRALAGDWGDSDPSDAKMNDAAVRDGSRIIASYNIPMADDSARTLWVIIDADAGRDDNGRPYTFDSEGGHVFKPGERYALTILLPSDY